MTPVNLRMVVQSLRLQVRLPTEAEWKKLPEATIRDLPGRFQADPAWPILPRFQLPHIHSFPSLGESPLAFRKCRNVFEWHLIGIVEIIIKLSH